MLLLVADDLGHDNFLVLLIDEVLNPFVLGLGQVESFSRVLKAVDLLMKSLLVEARFFLGDWPRDHRIH